MRSVDLDDLICRTLAEIYGPNRPTYEAEAARRSIDIHQLAAAALAQQLHEIGYIVRADPDH